MTNVLLIAGVAAKPGVLAASVRKLRDKGARVYLAAAAESAEPPADVELDGFLAFPEDVAKATPTRAAVHAPPGARVWMHARRQSWLRRQARRADVLVALDAHAVYTVWRLAQRHREADAIYGINSTLKVVDARAQGRPTRPSALTRVANAFPYPRLAAQGIARAVRSAPRSTINTVTAKPIMSSRIGAGLWRTAITLPGIPDKLRVKVAHQLAHGMAWAGSPEGEAQMLASAAGKLRNPRTRARLLGEAATRELAGGLAPRDLDKAVNALLRVADKRYSEGENGLAADLLNRAMTLAFHRVLHIDQLSSPLATDPEGYVAPFRRSAAGAKVVAPLGRVKPAAAAPTDRPLRLLIVTSANDNFLGLIREYYDEHPNVEVRFLDLAATPALKGLTWAARPMLEHRLAGSSTYGDKVEQRIRPHLDWADTVFIDWCVAPAALFTMIDPGTARVIVRLHSYEALSRWPHMMDFSRVDDIVFVAPHIRDLTTTLVPYLRGPDAPRLHILDNAMDLRGFQVEKEPDARFQLGMVGINQVAKDPRWAVEVLRRVRERDDRYRMLLIGGEMSPETSVATAEYLTAFHQDLAELEPSGAVRRFGPTNDVPKALAQIGVILSSSVREGCHCGLMEGAASAAVPVVRDWPFFAGRPNSARTLYPQGWVVGSPEEAAERILATTATEESWREAGAQAAEHALTAWDWSAVRHDFDRLLFNGDQRGVD
jgi:glycosyltransferase involved in cell wall biosynthesis